MSELATVIEHEIPRLKRYARSLVRDPNMADDLVQDCLTRALSRAHLWQPGTNLRAWLFTILHNIYVNIIRRSLREGRAVALDSVENILDTAATQPFRMDLRDLRKAIHRLPEEQRTVILLVGVEGLPYESVASILKVPVGTVRSRLSRARKAIRALMEAPEDETVKLTNGSPPSAPMARRPLARGAEPAMAA